MKRIHNITKFMILVPKIYLNGLLKVQLNILVCNGIYNSAIDCNLLQWVLFVVVCHLLSIQKKILQMDNFGTLLGRGLKCFTLH